MVTLNINGQQVSVPEKTTIMEAAENEALCMWDNIQEEE